MDPDFVFTFAHPEYYEELSRFSVTPEYEDRVRQSVPAEWEVGRSSVWLYANNPAATLPTQGFKIHVSSILKFALPVLDAIVPVCVDQGTSFKLAAGPALLALLNSKPYDRGGSGKFMTIYPPDEPTFVKLIKALHAATANTPFVGPYILTDRRYADSRILFYRYGGIMPRYRLSVDGSRHGVLEAPDGSVVRDQRLPCFQLPGWVTDPFGPPPQRDSGATATLGGRFAVHSMISISNRGGVYSGVDNDSGMPVVIKEARPFVNRMVAKGKALDGTDLLRNEHRILSAIAHLGHTPRPVAIFDEWEHTFLVQERVQAMGLRRFLAHTDNIMLPHILRDGVLRNFMPKFEALARGLIDAVERIHEAGVVLGDLSVTNVMVEHDTLRVTLIDLESAGFVEHDRDFLECSQYWYTPAFARPGRETTAGVTFDDDLYALGMILYNMLAADMGFFYLKPEGRALFLDKLVGLGIPTSARELITRLLEGQLAEARIALNRL